MLRLDAKDKKILSILERNGRIAHTQVAREVGVSKQVAAYRIANLVDNGVITRFTAVINSHKLGFVPYNVMFKLQHTTKAHEDRFISYLKNMNQVSWLISTIGKWDIIVSVLVKTPHAFTEWMDAVNEEFGSFIQEHTFYIVTDVIANSVRSERGLQGDLTTVTFGRLDDPYELKAIDRRLLEAITKNPRGSLLNFAEATACRPETVRARLAQLREAGILLGTHAKVHPSALGKQWFIVLLELGYGMSKERAQLCSMLKSRPEVTLVAEAFGQECNIVLDMLVDNTAHIKELMRSCAAQCPNAVKGYHPLQIHEEFKSQFIPDVLN